KDIRPEQLPFVRKKTDIQDWQLIRNEEISLGDVVHNAKPTVLIGVSGQQGAFTENAVREMAKITDRPVIFPLSNPTSRCEATPRQLLEWTSGRALIGTGSPFDPVEVNGRLVRIDQTNNSYIFPGLALGIIASRAERVSDNMIMAAAKALAGMSPTLENKEANLLPPLAKSRDVSRVVAEAVGKQAIADGLAAIADENVFRTELEANFWEPAYAHYEPTD